MSLLFNMLFKFVINFLWKSKGLLILSLQSLSTVILKPKKIKSVTRVKPISRSGEGKGNPEIYCWVRKQSCSKMMVASQNDSEAREQANMIMDDSTLKPEIESVITQW